LGAFTQIGAKWVNAPRQQAIILSSSCSCSAVWNLV
jgi:hypothetical protein